MKTKIILVLILLPTMSCRHDDKELTFIGLNDFKKSKAISISQTDYEEKLSPVMSQIYSETMNTLEETAPKNPQWFIEHIEVGIAVTGTLGIGLWKAGATPGFRLMFRPKK
jgi:hypothetical protein